MSTPVVVNPDNFIFHSNFWYPTNYESGYIDLSAVSVPASFLLSSNYKPGDYYNAFQEVTYSGITYVYYVVESDTFWVNTTGNNLYAFKGAQSAGQTYTGRIHYRLYHPPDPFSFISQGKLEKPMFVKSGTTTIDYSYGEISIPVPEATELAYIKGVWRVAGGTWYGMDVTSNPNGFCITNFESNAGTYSVNLDISLFNSSDPTNDIEYKLVGIKLYD